MFYCNPTFKVVLNNKSESILDLRSEATCVKHPEYLIENYVTFRNIFWESIFQIFNLRVVIFQRVLACCIRVHVGSAAAAPFRQTQPVSLRTWKRIDRPSIKYYTEIVKIKKVTEAGGRLPNYHNVIVTRAFIIVITCDL